MNVTRTETKSPRGRRIAVGQIWADDLDGYLYRVVGIARSGRPIVRHVNAKRGGHEARAAWFDVWMMTTDTDRD